jgi:hypothetical protein
VSPVANSRSSSGLKSDSVEKAATRAALVTRKRVRTRARGLVLRILHSELYFRKRERERERQTNTRQTRRAVALPVTRDSAREKANATRMIEADRCKGMQLLSILPSRSFDRSPLQSSRSNQPRLFAFNSEHQARHRCCSVALRKEIIRLDENEHCCHTRSEHFQAN